jgi:hypothetical protein
LRNHGGARGVEEDMMLFAALFAAGMAVPPQPAAHPVVVELFTSQGCSSCPPAEEVLSDLGAEDGVIAIAWHVDYWDDLGWPDPFSSPDWTARQRAYASSWGRGKMYTPQAVVAGSVGMVGSSRSEIVSALRDARAKPAAGSAEVAVAKDTVTATVSLTAPATRALDVLAVVVETGLVTKIARGENGGRTLKNDFVARKVVRLGSVPAGERGASGLAAPLGIDASWKRGSSRVVLLVQDPSSGAILATAVHAL